jgi:ankyrin repeat protein
MHAAKKELTAFENLVTDLLMLILIQTQDPIHLGRLMQVSKAFRGKLLGDRSKALWQLFLQSEFPKFQISQNSSNYQQLFITQAEGKTKTSKLTKEHRRLHNLIKIGDLTSIRSGKNLPDMSNEAFLYANKDTVLGAAYIARKFNRQEILDFFYDLLYTKVFSTRDKDQQGRSALHWAAACNILSSVEQCIKLYKDINLTDKSSFTPLNLAAAFGNLDVVRALLAAGANNRANSGGGNPLHVAAQMRHNDVISELLAAGYNVHDTTNLGATALHISAREGNPKSIELLLAAGANINAATKVGDTSLHIAVGSGAFDNVKVLVARGCNVHLTTNQGSTPLHFAAAKGHSNIVKGLLVAGCPVNRPKIDGSTPLHLAAQEGHLDVVIELLRVGAEVNIGTNQGGYTPLYLAADSRQTAIVRALLKAGANDNVLYDGKFVVDRAKDAGHQPTYTVLKLWQTYERVKDRMVCEQLINILKTQTSLSWSNAVSSYFFTSQEDRQCDEICNDIMKLVNNSLKDGSEAAAAFRELFESKRSVIPADKYQFIMDFVLAPKVTVRDESITSFELK